MKKLVGLFLLLLLFGCGPYVSPERASWAGYLRGASFSDMSEIARQAKHPVLLGAGGRTIDTVVPKTTRSEYGDMAANDNVVNVAYMSKLEYVLYDALRKPGISVQRAGSDVVIILVRDAIMELNAPEISKTGDDTLNTIAKILNQYDATYIEIAGYTDSMRDSNAAHSFSLDMAQRVGVYFARHNILTARMFVVGRGSARPIAAQDDMGRLTNRRVEIRIAPAR